MTEPLHIERRSGDALARHIPDLAELRIRVFREFPYLYAGDRDYEERYLRTYVASRGAVIALAFDGGRVVGAATAIPLAEETPNIQRPFRDAGFDIDRVFYFGESVLLPEYRGRGAGVRFFEEREAAARESGDFRFCAFCAVDRPVDHPRRPAGYRPLDEFWRRRGYQRRPDLRTVISWRDLDEDRETEKPMTFWLRPLERGA
jgi:GNAT superfamily N-acetyltransferase